MSEKPQKEVVITPLEVAALDEMMERQKFIAEATDYCMYILTLKGCFVGREGRA